MTKIIKEEFKKLESLKISDDSFTYNISLEFFHNEFNRMSRMDDDLFTCEVEIPGLASIPCDLNEEDDSEQQLTHGSSFDMEYDPSNTRGDDEVELTDKESFDYDDDDVVAEIFRIDTNEEPTPMEHYCEPFSFKMDIWNGQLVAKKMTGWKTNEALKNKATMEGIIDEDNESHNEGWRRWDGYENAIHDHEEIENEEEHGNEERCELFDNPQEVLV
nr:hypothetical protein [Tanacetum cinerariifolium]